MIEKVERLITEINRIHLEYSKDYFETGKVEKNQSQAYLFKSSDESDFILPSEFT